MPAPQLATRVRPWVLYGLATAFVVGITGCFVIYAINGVQLTYAHAPLVVGLFAVLCLVAEKPNMLEIVPRVIASVQLWRAQIREQDSTHELRLPSKRTSRPRRRIGL